MKMMRINVIFMISIIKWRTKNKRLFTLVLTRINPISPSERKKDSKYSKLAMKSVNSSAEILEPALASSK